MRLSSVNYSEFAGRPEEWNLEPLQLGLVNLIVGKNSSGKTRALNIVAVLGSILSGKQDTLYNSGTWDATFAEDGELKTRYSISFENKEVQSESLTIDSKEMLSRDQHGKGSVFAEKENRAFDFIVPSNQVVAVARRDSLQHPYLENLFNWGISVKHIRFGSDLGQTTFTVLVRRSDGTKPPWRDIDNNAAIFRRAMEEFGATYKQKLLDDLMAIGYDCEDVGLMIPPGLEDIATPAPVGLFVKERDLACPTTQVSMSVGMYRALSILVNVNAGIMANHFQMVLIDDIGEGLDFERSRRLISLLIDRAEQHSFQLVMTTNDRFIMNAVPLKFWTLLHRTGKNVRVFNYQNSKEQFEEFEYLGLNNFDFFSGSYFLENRK